MFDSVFSAANIYAAYMDARRCKRSKPACLAFERSLATNLEQIERSVKAGEYRPAPLRSFVVREPKERVVHAPPFRDLVVQHAIYRIAWPVFDASFIGQSFACRPGYGTHRCADYVQQAMRKCGDGEVSLHLDVKRYFYSIDRAILRSLIERKLKDGPLIDVMMRFSEMPGDKGIPIGNLLSQMFALIYLSPIDHYIKRELKVSRYARYMDDMLLLGLSRQRAIECSAAIEERLGWLGLELSKSVIKPIGRGVNFVGYRTWRGRRFIRKHSLYKFKAAAKRGDRDVVVSILGHAKHTSSHAHLLRILRETNNDIYLSLQAQ